MQITDPLWKALPDRTPDVTAGEDITTLVTFTCHQTPDPVPGSPVETLYQAWHSPRYIARKSKRKRKKHMVLKW